MTSLGVRFGGGKTFSFLINADQTTETSKLVRRRTDAPAGCGGGGFHHHQLKPNQHKMIYNCRAAAAAGAVNTVTSSSCSSLVHVDPIFRTELEEICSSCPTNRKRANNGKRERNRVGVDHQVPPPNPTISAEKLDDWIKYSVSEIVRNIGDAPLLVHLYSKNKGGSSSSSPPTNTTTIPVPIIERIEKSEPESWAGIARRWEEGSHIPDGIILVEQLNDANEEEEKEQLYANSSSTKTWGLVIQGRGADSASSCYILKTCRVLSSLGFCTHFCLVRAKCFGEIADLQLKNSWLLHH